jgi:hypothetical protein
VVQLHHPAKQFYHLAKLPHGLDVLVPLDILIVFLPFFFVFMSETEFVATRFPQTAPIVWTSISREGNSTTNKFKGTKSI